MGVKIKGVRSAQSGLGDWAKTMQGRKAARAASIGAHIVAPLAALHTPIDTSLLVNSQYTQIIKEGTKVIGRVGYSAAYALFVENATGTLKGQPRRGKKSKGNYWDPNGKPGFLSDALAETSDEVFTAMAKEMQP